MGRGRKAKQVKQKDEIKIEQTLTWELASSYVDTVEETFKREGQISKYQDFLQLLTDFTTDAVPVDQVAARINDLFRLHPQLLIGFNDFLPEQYHFHPATTSGSTADHCERFR